MPDIAILGRYWPGISPLHRMDPRAKMLMVLAVMVVIFSALTFFGLAVCTLFLIACFLIAQIPLKQAVRSILPLIFIAIIPALLNLFFVQGGEVLFHWAFITISEGGVYQAAFIGCRLVLLLLSASLLTLTTTTLDMTDAFEYLLAPFARFGIPAHELSMIMGIALRFLPQFITELQTIYRAQISRGANFSTSPVKGGLRMVTSLIVPLFTSAFRHAETLSLAMDARCYHGGPGRTRLNPLRYGPIDRNAAIVLVAVFALVIATNLIF